MSKEKRAAYNTGSWALLGAVIGAVFVVNFLLSGVVTRLDLTSANRYTLSKSTREMLNNLPDVLTIRAVYSSNLPSQLKVLKNDAVSLIEEYDNYGKGKVKLEFVDPAGKKDLQADLNKLGVYPFSLTTMGMDQAGVLEVYAAIVINYLDKSEVIPQALSIDSLEYDLTSAIARVIAEKKPKIGFFNPGGQRKFDQEFGRLKKILSAQYEAVDVDNREKGRVPEDIDCLIVINPYGLSDRDLFDLDQYIMGGGQTIFLTESTRVILQPSELRVPMPVYAMGMNEQVDPLGPMLKSYGVARNYDMVMEPTNLLVYNIIPGLAGYKYPPFIQVKAGGVEHRLLEGLEVLTFAWASSLSVQPNLPEGVTALVLARSSAESYVQTGNQLMVDFESVPKVALPLPGMGPEARDLAVLLSGTFPSYFAGKPVPEPGPEGGSTAEPPPRIEKGRETNILVVGNSYFVSDQIAGVFPAKGSLELVHAAAEWMSGGQGLSDISKRQADPPPLTFKAPRLDIIMVGFILPLSAPLGAIVFGVSWLSIRKSKKRKYLENA